MEPFQVPGLKSEETIPIFDPENYPQKQTLKGIFFSKSAYQRLAKFCQKARRIPFSEEPIIFIRNSSILVLSDHFWGVNSDLGLFSSSKNCFCDIRKDTPKSYGMEYELPKLPLPHFLKAFFMNEFFLKSVLLKAHFLKAYFQQAYFPKAYFPTAYT